MAATFTLTTSYFVALASWMKGSIENAIGRIRRWLPCQSDFEKRIDKDIRDTTSLNLTPRNCPGFKSLAAAFLSIFWKSACQTASILGSQFTAESTEEFSIQELPPSRECPFPFFTSEWQRTRRSGGGVPNRTAKHLATVLLNFFHKTGIIMKLQ